LETSQIPRHLGNFPDTQAFGKFPRYSCIWEISKILKIYHPEISVGIWEISQIPRHLGNSPNSYRYLRVVHFKDFGNFSNDWIFGESPKNLGIWEIPQMSGYSGNSSGMPQMPGYLGNIRLFEKFPKSLKIYHTQIFVGIWEIPIFDIFDNCCHSLYFLYFITN